MDVLATQFKRNAEEREGYLSISEVVEDGFKQYIFNSAIKLKPTKIHRIAASPSGLHSGKSHQLQSK
ncbi:UNVERIFIED_ORG: hypothetical protein [Escherichia phage CMSTMSU]